MPTSSKPSSTSSSRVPPRAPPLPPSTSSSSSASATAASKNIALVSTLLQGLTEEDFDLAPSSSQSSQPPKKPLSTSSKLNSLNSFQQPSRLPPAPAALVDEYSSLFDDFPIDDDWEADLLQPAPTKVKQQLELESPLLILNPPPTAPPMEWSPRAWVRCTVSKVEDGGRDGNGWGRKRVLVTTHRTNHPLSLRLEGEYAELPISPADILNIISPDLPSFVHSSSASPSVTIKLENADPCFTNDVLLRNDSTSTTASSNDEPTTTTVNEIVFSTSHPENFIIFHPDLLLPNTTISTSLSCPRKSVMSGLVKIRSPPTLPLLNGNLLHATLQALLSTTPYPTLSTFSPSNIKRVSDQILTEGDDSLRGDLWKAGLRMEDVREEVGRKAVEAFGRLGERFLGGEKGVPKPEGTLGGSSTSLLSLTGLHDTEEDIRSPMWGIQGKIDVSIQATILDPASSSSSTNRNNKSKNDFFARRGGGKENVPLTGPSVWKGKGREVKHEEEEAEGGGESWTMPFEIKTGRAVGVMEHRAQTMLYTLLMEDRYSTPIPSGLLYYSQSDTILQIPAAKHELRSLVTARNTLAGYLARKRPPPPSTTPATTAASNPNGSIPSTSTATANAQTDELTPSTSMELVELALEDEDAKKRREEQEMEDAMWGEMDGAGAMEVDGEEERKGEEVAEEERPSFLPPTIDNDWECKRCYQVDSCMLYRKAVEQVEDTNSPIADLYEKKTGHLSVVHADFFRKWEELISFEEQDATRFASELWTMSSVEREKTGRCFGNMIVESYEVGSGASASKVHRHTYRFRRATLPPSPSQKPSSSSSSSKPDTYSLLSGHLSAGEPISVSIEPDLLSLARGFILELTPTHLTVGLDHKLDVEVLISRLRGEGHGSRLSGLGLTRSEDPLTQIFRIDKDELASGMGRIRDNLAQMFFVDGDEKRRSLVVDLDPPQFDESLKPTEEEMSGRGLNGDQKLAMEKVMTAKDYALILGMPGTGKTTTIVEIIVALAKRGKSVLLTSYTHSAVDTILVKLLNLNLRLLRLGNPDKIHPDCQHLTLGALGPAANMEQYEHRLMSPQVVATTALTIDHPVFSRRKFDYCIVDEASQITLPVCLGPLRFADTFILVGDHFQLPPLVKNPNARLGGLDVSLFRRLHEAHPSASVDLSQQYRMNSDIMELSNTLIYDGKLKCGSKKVAEQKLVLPKREEARKVMHGEGEGSGCGMEGDGCWLEGIMEESCKVAFLDTDQVPCPDSRIGHLIQNVGEAHLAHQISRSFVLAGVDPRQIGIITLYRQQIKLLQHVFKGDEDLKEIEILTADKSQGRDKDVIIISMVRSNETGSIGELLRDWRRINVALTRARSKLIILGSQSTLRHDPLLAKFFNLIGSNDWITTLPKEAGGMHSGLAKIEEVKREVDEMAVEEEARRALKRGLEEVVVDGAASAAAGEVGGGGKKLRVGKETLERSRPLLSNVMKEME